MQQFTDYNEVIKKTAIEALKFKGEGKIADYIPELASVEMSCIELFRLNCLCFLQIMAY